MEGEPWCARVKLLGGKPGSKWSNSSVFFVDLQLSLTVAILCCFTWNCNDEIVGESRGESGFFDSGLLILLGEL